MAPRDPGARAKTRPWPPPPETKRAAHRVATGERRIFGRAAASASQALSPYRTHARLSNNGGSSVPEDFAPNAAAASPLPTCRNDLAEWYAAGFQPVPIIPVGVQLVPGSKIKADDLGKIPGMRQEGGDFWHGYRWDAPDRLYPHYQREMMEQSAREGGVGLLGERTIGVDIDVLDIELAAELRKLVISTCGWTPTRVGQAPKCLLPYRLPMGTLPPSTRTFRWRMPDGREHGIEIIGKGRQFVVDAVHPKTRQPYGWDVHPLDCQNMIPELPPKKLRELIEVLLAAMERAGGQLKTFDVRGGHDGTNPPKPEDLMGDESLVIDALRHIPNRPETSREEWIALGNAMKAAAGDRWPVAAMLAWTDWSLEWEPPPGHEPNTEESCETNWARMKPPFWIGADYVFAKAAATGWSRLRVLQEAFGADPLPAAEQVAAEAEEEARKHRPRVLLQAGPKDEALEAYGFAVRLAPDLFANAGRELIVIDVQRQPSDDLAPQADGIPRMRLATHSDVHLAACARVEFVKLGRNGVPAPCDPPRDLSRDYIATRHGQDARQLVGFATVPSIDEHGEINAVEGYDGRSGLFHMPCPAFDVPAAPTEEDVRAALELLRKPFSEFAFADHQQGFAIVLAALLTGIRRPWLKTAPMFLATAPAAGTGKGLLLTTVCRIAFGFGPTAFTWGPDEAEQEKRLGAALLAGAPALLADNVNGGVIQGDFIESVLTSPAVAIRVLGLSRQAQAGTRALLLATGNHAAVGGDMTRRALVIELDPACERPELRQFDMDPIDFATRRRADILAAAFTLLRGFRRAGRPGSGKPPLGSFEDWSREVRDVVAWSTGIDVLEAMAANREKDPERRANAAVLTALHEHFGGQHFSGTELAEWARQIPYGDPLLEAIATALKPRAGRSVEPKLAGYWARRVDRTVLGGLRLSREVDNRAGANRYLIERVTP